MGDPLDDLRICLTALLPANRRASILGTFPKKSCSMFSFLEQVVGSIEGCGQTVYITERLSWQKNSHRNVIKLFAPGFLEKLLFFRLY